LGEGFFLGGGGEVILKEVLFGIMRALLPFINRHDKDRFFLIRLTFFLNRHRFFAHFYLNIVTFLRRVSLKKGCILRSLKHRLPLRRGAPPPCRRGTVLAFCVNLLGFFEIGSRGGSLLLGLEVVCAVLSLVSGRCEGGERGYFRLLLGVEICRAHIGLDRLITGVWQLVEHFWR